MGLQHHGATSADLLWVCSLWRQSGLACLGYCRYLQCLLNGIRCSYHAKSSYKAASLHQWACGGDEHGQGSSWNRPVGLGTAGTAGTLGTVGTVEQLVTVLTQPVSLVTVLEASGSQT